MLRQRDGNKKFAHKTWKIRINIIRIIDTNK